MGLCKCPKRKVTNLFCFEHRVNVCENCLVTNHSKCVVQSYLKWLQDSDYNPTCALCSARLDDERFGECVRLICYDLFHWSCLNEFASKLPLTTAPAGYQCPTCKDCIIPAANVVSPVAEQIRNYLSRVNWARTAMGLPATSDQNIPAQPPSVSVGSERKSPPTGTIGESQSGKPILPVQPYNQSGVGYSQPQVVSRSTESTGGSSGNTYIPPVNKEHILNMSDHDTDKYARRSPFHFLSNWFRSRDITGSSLSGGSKRVAGPPSSIQKRFFIVIGIGVLSFITFVVVLSRLSRGAADDDPTLDMLANPNIRVGELDNYNQ